ncbi:MAG TPA: DUF6067 family protein [Planctomycetota bacterium]|nr:DUF6067 family protein [Planctomycetota bacterium]
MSKLTILAAAAFLLGALAVGGEAAAPGAVQVWNAAPWQTVAVGDFTGANPEMKALKPVELLGTRNGVCSGFVVVTRDGAAIKGLKASVGDLTMPGGGGSTSSPPNALSPSKGQGRIPAARVAVRFADIARPETSFMPPHRFDRLLEAAPAEVPVATAVAGKAEYGVSFTPRSTAPVATVPVWVTVRVPADAPAGDYEGRLTVEAEGLAATVVPVKLKVHDWAMPDPKDFRVRTIGWMNPEALARHYNDVGLKVPLWSEKHFELMGRSMALMLELGSRHVVINVTKDYPARDNTDTMVKWVKQPDGSYKYDFTLFDKYCDLAASVIGKPFPVRISIWRGPRTRDKENETYDFLNATVLTVDPATGQVSDLAAPTKFGSEEMKAF